MDFCIFIPENGTRERFFASAEIVWSIREDNGFIYGFKFANMKDEQANVLKAHLCNLT